MGSSFTSQEKRFVLAEMIKSSGIGLEDLVFFVKSNGIYPNWMTMQLPFGRNMEQCMQVADSLEIRSSTPPSLRSIVSQSHHAAKVVTDHPVQAAAMMNSVAHPPGLPPGMPSHVAILPRPANGIENGRMPPHQAPREVKKRGRPSRADRSKNDQRPRLLEIAPRPPQPTPGATAPRPILPAISRSLNILPPPAVDPRCKKKRRTEPAITMTATAPSPAPAVAATAAVVTEDSVQPASNNHEQVELQVPDSSTCAKRLQSPFHMPVEPEPPSVNLLPAPAPVPSALSPSQIKA